MSERIPKSSGAERGLQRGGYLVVDTALAFWPDLEDEPIVDTAVVLPEETLARFRELGRTTAATFDADAMTQRHDDLVEKILAGITEKV